MKHPVNDLLEEINYEFAELGLDTRPTIVLPGQTQQTPAPPTPRSDKFPLLQASAVGLLGGLLFTLFYYYLSK
jgi:hypothetical protein